MPDPHPPPPPPDPAGDPAGDPVELARSSTLDELQRMRAAEELHRLRTDRTARRSRLSIAGQVQADKYRAFFETSMLVTDTANSDKRLVGYALVQGLVRGPTYDEKAMIMLEESLSQELRGEPGDKLDDARRAAVRAIPTSLAGTDDRRALHRAARSVDRVARYHARMQDEGETREVVDVYVRRLVGRAALVCGTLEDFRAVRQPIRGTMPRNPELLGLNSPTEADANPRMAAILRQKCEEEMAYSGASECPAILRDYAALCGKGGREPSDDRAACEVVEQAVAGIPTAAQPSAQPPPAGSAP